MAAVLDSEKMMKFNRMKYQYIFCCFWCKPIILRMQLQRLILWAGYEWNEWQNISPWRDL